VVGKYFEKFVSILAFGSAFPNCMFENRRI